MNRAFDPTHVLKDIVDNTGICKHLGDKKQGDKLRNGNRCDEDCSPKFLELDAFGIDDHCDNHT